MAYQRADALTQLVESKLKKLQDYIKSMDDSFQFLDFVNEISGVSEYLGTFSSKSDETISDELKNEIEVLQTYFTDIINYINVLKDMNLKISPTNVNFDSKLDEEYNAFLTRVFPNAPD